MQKISQMNFLKIFMPKDRIFYSLFEEIADTVAKMGVALKQVVNEPNYDKRCSMVSQVETMEHINDELTHKVFTELGRNFITPFDREDIHYLATALDDVADYIYAAAKKIIFYRLNPNDPGILKMADLIEQSSEEIKKAVSELRNMRNMRLITDALVRINSIENQEDDVYDMSIDLLFQNDPDAKEVINKREINQEMEK